MPSRVANGATSSRFELPALDLNFGSITDGTNIPPPPASPVQKSATPPRTPAQKTDKEAAAKDADKPAATNGKIAGIKRPAEGPPASPGASSRQGSLRRLFSRNTLNNSYVEGNQTKDGSVSTAAATLERPASRSAGSYMDNGKAKRSSGWFRRLRTGDGPSNKRTSLLSEEVTAPTSPLKPTGPPPPMIPELKELEKDEGSLGNDLFKNI